jgi:hypothetical protein
MANFDAYRDAFQHAKLTRSPELAGSLSNGQSAMSTPQVPNPLWIRCRVNGRRGDPRNCDVIRDQIEDVRTGTMANLCSSYPQ